jgi:hypothetical protein
MKIYLSLQKLDSVIRRSEIKIKINSFNLIKHTEKPPSQYHVKKIISYENRMRNLLKQGNHIEALTKMHHVA